MQYNPTDSRWMTAVNRAIEQKLRASKFLVPNERQSPDAEGYLVESSRADGSWYVVELFRGVVSHDLICSCPAGKNRMPCKHAARVLLREGLFAWVKPEKIVRTLRKAA